MACLRSSRASRIAVAEARLRYRCTSRYRAAPVSAELPSAGGGRFRRQAGAAGRRRSRCSGFCGRRSSRAAGRLPASQPPRPARRLSRLSRFSRLGRFCRAEPRAARLSSAAYVASLAARRRSGGVLTYRIVSHLSIGVLSFRNQIHSAKRRVLRQAQFLVPRRKIPPPTLPGTASRTLPATFIPNRERPSGTARRTQRSRCPETRAS